MFVWKCQKLMALNWRPFNIDATKIQESDEKWRSDFVSSEVTIFVALKTPRKNFFTWLSDWRVTSSTLELHSSYQLFSNFLLFVRSKRQYQFTWQSVIIEKNIHFHIALVFGIVAMCAVIYLVFSLRDWAALCYCFLVLVITFLVDRCWLCFLPWRFYKYTIRVQFAFFFAIRAPLQNFPPNRNQSKQIKFDGSHKTRSHRSWLSVQTNKNIILFFFL